MRLKGRMLSLMSVSGVLCACTPDESPFRGSDLIRVVPGGSAVSVINARTEGEARPWATAYCSKQGLSPRFKGMGMRWRSDSAEFDCLAASGRSPSQAFLN